MAKIGITFEEVESVAEKILSEGQNPTIERIRYRLGTGSNSTISKYLQDWRAGRLIASTQDIPAPNNPPDPVHAAVNQVWEKIKDETATQIKTIQEKADTEIALSYEARDAAILERDKIQQSLELCEKRLNQVSADKEIALLDLKTLEQEQALLQQRYQQLEKYYNELKKHTEDSMIVLNTRYQELQENHKKEIDRLTLAHDKLIKQLTHDHNNSLQDKMVQIDHLKTSEKKNKQCIDELLSIIQNQKIELTTLKTEICFINNERDKSIAETLKKDNIIQSYQQLEQKLGDIFGEIRQIKENDCVTEINNKFSCLTDSINYISSLSKSIIQLIKTKELISVANDE